MKQFFGKKSRNALASVFIISLALHLVGIVILGMIKLVSEVLREETVFEAPLIAPVPQKQPEYTVNIKQRNLSTPPPRPPAIVVNNPSKLDIPPLDIDVNVDSTSVYSRDAGGFGGGLADIRDMTITADMFGMKFSATNLGVVLDISGSAQAHLDKALREIDKSFPAAYIMLVVGCGISETNGLSGRISGQRIVPGKPRVIAWDEQSKEAEYISYERGPIAQLGSFYRKMGETRSKELKQYFDNRKNLFLLYGGDVNAANYAFDFLIKQDVDTIYWFADFTDRIESPVILDLIRTLKRKSIKVIAHNFMGKAVRAEVKEMAKQTGGATIELIPGK